MILGLEFPPISHVVEWPTLFGGGAFAVNKVIILMWVSAALAFGVMYLGGRKQALVPAGTQNIAEATVGFIEDGIIMETIGPDGLKYTPYLLTLFTFILTCNIWGLIPGVQMPVNARIALPAFMAILVWLAYHFIGIKSQGPFKYFKSATIPPGVPKAILPLVFLSAFEVLVAFLQAYIFTILAAVYIGGAMHPEH